METYKNKNRHSNRIGSGVILLGIGLIFFFRNFGIGIPDWIFSWHMLLILIGLTIGYRRNFNGSGWLIMVLIGAYFTLEEIAHLDLSAYYFGAALVILGLYMILRPGGPNKGKKKVDFNLTGNTDTNDALVDENNRIDSINIFAGNKQHIYSKDFQGGDVTLIFGGCDLNLMQADFKDTITIDVIAVFGGLKIIIPPNWTVKSELTPIFGGFDDKRTVLPMGGQPDKVIKIKGVVLFGGVDIRNY